MSIAPGARNQFYLEHLVRLDYSLKHWTGRELVRGFDGSVQTAERIFHAPFALVSHDHRDDPIFTYGNRAALSLWEMTWEEFTRLHSRKSAELSAAAAREKALADVRAHGFCDGYSGIRIAKSGRRFRIEKVVMWNVIDGKMNHLGQAAMFDHWTFL